MIRLLIGRVVKELARVETDPAPAHLIRSEHRHAYRLARNCCGGYRDECEPFRHYCPTGQWPTQKMVDKIREKGISVLSYFIKDSYGSSYGDFTTMYGKDAKDIDVTNVMSVAKTMNDRFLQK